MNLDCRLGRPVALLAVLALTMATAAPAADAQQREVPDTYTAVTVDMTPADVELKADVLRWSSDDERAAVVAALTEAEDVVAALRELPTLGVVWREGSAVGHSIKYAHRTVHDDGSETVTLVTDKRIGSTSFNPWTIANPLRETPLEYSVLEMTTGDAGTLSLAAEPVVDTAAATITLDRTGPAVLTDVTKQPKPYWANQK